MERMISKIEGQRLEVTGHGKKKRLIVMFQ